MMTMRVDVKVMAMTVADDGDGMIVETNGEIVCEGDGKGNGFCNDGDGRTFMASTTIRPAATALVVAMA